jgi:protein TonB
MNEFELEAMLNDVTVSIANPPVPHGLEARLKARVFALEMTQVAVPGDVLTFGTLDRLASGQQTRRTALSALLLHAAILLLVFFEVRAMHMRIVAPNSVSGEVVLNAPPTPPPASPLSAKVSRGGGGHAGAKAVTRGMPPPPVTQQLLPLESKPVDDPKLAVPAGVVMQMVPQSQRVLPDIGVENAAPAPYVSAGNGSGSGVGAGSGAGIGAGFGASMGGGVRKVGGGVSAPVPLYTPDAEFSEEARKAKVAGNVLVYLEVDATGRPQHVRVLRGIGMGLDEKAVEAVRQYRFKPAMEDGQPVAVQMNVEVVFNIY